MKLHLLALVLFWALPPAASAQVAILHIQVIEGEGTVHVPGARVARPLTVEVTDETGKPVEGASISFHLPEEGPGGSFNNGLRTDVALTDARGRAALHSLQLNRTPGRFPIRIVATREQARAGTVAFQYITGPATEARSAIPSTPATTTRVTPNAPTTPAASRGVLKWVVLGAVAAAAAAAGVLTAGKSGSPSGSSTTASTPSISIGSPLVTVGKP